MIVTRHAAARIKDRIGHALTDDALSDLLARARPYDDKRDRWTFRPALSTSFEYHVTTYRGRALLLVCATDADEPVLVSVYAAVRR